MAIYEYRCDNCGTVKAFFNFEPVPQCQCGGKLVKIMSVPLRPIIKGNPAIEKKASEEKEYHDNLEGEQREWSESCKKVKEADEYLEKEFAHISNTRTPERAKYLEKRSTEGTQEYAEHRERLGLHMEPAEVKVDNGT